MTAFERGDVVVVDLGMTGKVRPCVVVSVSNPDSRRNMCVVVPMTTEIRGERAGHRRSGQRKSRAAYFRISC